MHVNSCSSQEKCAKYPCKTCVSVSGLAVRQFSGDYRPLVTEEASTLRLKAQTGN